VRRHPHVFGEAAARDAGMQRAAWEEQKKAERAARAEMGTLAGIPVALPALTRAQKLTARAGRVGFDWPDAAAVLEKLDEEVAELRAELPGADPARLADEVGDLLFVLANLARKLDLDPERCLREANAKFARRFGHIEAALAEEGTDDLLLCLSSGGWPGTEMIGEEDAGGRRCFESVEVAGVLRATRAALAAFAPGGEDAKLPEEVRRLFAAIVRHYEGSKLALPLNDATDLSAVAAVELLLRAPALGGGEALERTAAGLVTRERVPRGAVVSLLPVLAVFCAGVPARFLEYQWRQGDLIVGDLGAMEEDEKTTFCHFAVVEDYCQSVFGKWSIFFGDRGHLGTEAALALRRTRSLRRTLKLSFYAGIWPCLVATADLPKGRVLLPAPPPQRQEAAPSQAPTATAAAPPPSPGTPSSLCAALASSIAEANAQASAERRERRKGGGLGAQNSPTGAPRPLRREPAEVEQLPRDFSSARAKRGRLTSSAQKRQSERQRRANEAFLKETEAARRREEDRLQSLEILEIEERLRAAVLEAARKPSKKKGKACCGGVKVPGPVVAQLFCKPA